MYFNILQRYKQGGCLFTERMLRFTLARRDIWQDDFKNCLFSLWQNPTFAAE
jgi:hypothetical protein